MFCLMVLSEIGFIISDFSVNMSGCLVVLAITIVTAEVVDLNHQNEPLELVKYYDIL